MPSEYAGFVKRQTKVLGDVDERPLFRGRGFRGQASGGRRWLLEADGHDDVGEVRAGLHDAGLVAGFHVHFDLRLVDDL